MVWPCLCRLDRTGRYRTERDAGVRRERRRAASSIDNAGGSNSSVSNAWAARSITSTFPHPSCLTLSQETQYDSLVLALLDTCFPLCTSLQKEVCCHAFPAGTEKKCGCDTGNCHFKLTKLAETLKEYCRAAESPAYDTLCMNVRMGVQTDTLEPIVQRVLKLPIDKNAYKATRMGWGELLAKCVVGRKYQGCSVEDLLSRVNALLSAAGATPPPRCDHRPVTHRHSAIRETLDTWHNNLTQVDDFTFQYIESCSCSTCDRSTEHNIKSDVAVTEWRLATISTFPCIRTFPCTGFHHLVMSSNPLQTDVVVGCVPDKKLILRSATATSHDQDELQAALQGRQPPVSPSTPPLTSIGAMGACLGQFVCDSSILTVLGTELFRSRECVVRLGPPGCYTDLKRSKYRSIDPFQTFEYKDAALLGTTKTSQGAVCDIVIQLARPTPSAPPALDPQLLAALQRLPQPIPAPAEGQGYALVNASCFDVLPSLPHNSVDLVIIDPPYEMLDKGWDRLWKDAA